MSPADCERLRELGAEVALGIADGEDRAWALDHLTECPECRARIERLSSLADELLMVAPSIEPPNGFEARVTEAIHGPAQQPQRRRRRRWALPLATAAAAAACAAAAVWFALGNDRDLADSYRATRPVGYVYGYQGRTSWVLAVVYDGVPGGRYQLQLVTRDGRKLPLRPLVVAGGRGSIGGATPVDYDQLAEVRLLGPGGREVADSDLRD